MSNYIIRNMWVCYTYNFKGKLYVNEDSMSYTRSHSIKKQLKGGDWNWAQWKRKGWKCGKFNIDFQLKEKE